MPSPRIETNSTIFVLAGSRCARLWFALCCACALACASPFGVSRALAEPVAQPPGVPATAATPAVEVTPPPIGTAAPNATAAPSPSASLPPTGRRLAAYRLYADRIAFYANRYVLGADGHVIVLLGDGTRITGNTFFNDLRLNRFIVAGNVTLSAGGRVISGAAFSEYLAFDRAYFIPVLGEPDRWTFAAGDYVHPLFGREMPGDTFFLPDLSGESVTIYSQHATIDPQRSVRFNPAAINFGFARVSFPTYFLNFSPNSNFAQNSLSGAFGDGPLDFAGGEHALATAHLRYDSVDHFFLAYEQHQVSDNSYLVASINPLTRPFKQYNVLGYDRLSPGMQATFIFQDFAFQHDFSTPLSSSALSNFALTGSLPHSYVTLGVSQFYDSLLAQPELRDGLYYYGDQSHPWIPDHPSQASLSWIGYRHQVNDLPLNFQLRSSYGFGNNGPYGEQSLGNVVTNVEFYKSLGINVSTKSLTLLADKSGRHEDLYFTGSFDRQIQWFSLPHHIDTTLVSASLTKIFNQHAIFLVQYVNTNIGDHFGAQQSLVYPPGASFFNFDTGQTIAIPGFHGFSTSRALTEQFVFTPSQALSFNLSMREDRDFPRPIAGPLELVGDQINFVNFGVAPLQFAFDVRYRLNSVLVLDLSRVDNFNFGGYERWTPQFSFEIEK
jgi:hypothetical protein